MLTTALLTLGLIAVLALMINKAPDFFDDSFEEADAWAESQRQLDRVLKGGSK